jgi:nickel superoxide dismutase
MKGLGLFGRGILKNFDRAFGFDVAYAHCDIPCGIYDPHMAQVAAHTVIRMDMLIAALPKDNPMAEDTREKFVRYTIVKEQHAEICKNEVRVLWGDYFKPEHAQANPELHGLVFDTLKLASKARQGTNLADAEALLGSVQKIAEIFWKTKNVQTKRVKSPYPSEHEMVYPLV